jgi:hypothetical protein
MNREEAIGLLQKLLDEGLDMDGALAELRKAGAGPIPSILAVKQTTGKTILEAREVVRDSPVWRDMREQWEKLDAFLGQIIDMAES